MPRTRRTFSPEFKAKLVLEVLKGEKELNVIATENNIQQNLLRNWKKEFLDKASIVFDDSREDASEKNLLLSATRKINTPRRLVSSPCRWTGSKKSEEMLGPDYESKYSSKPFED